MTLFFRLETKKIVGVLQLGRRGTTANGISGMDGGLRVAFSFSLFLY